MSQFFCGLPLLLQMLLRVAMVISVSTSWVRIEPGRDSSSSLSLQASALAMAVMQAVNSQGFTEDHPMPLYERQGFGAYRCAAGGYSAPDSFG